MQVKLELGHRAQVRKKPTVEGFTHDWMVFVRGPEHSNIQHFVEKVVFHLHESFPRPKRGQSSFSSLHAVSWDPGHLQLSSVAQDSLSTQILMVEMNSVPRSELAKMTYQGLT